MAATPGILDIVASLLPSPDSGQLTVVVIVPRAPTTVTRAPTTVPRAPTTVPTTPTTVPTTPTTVPRAPTTVPTTPTTDTNGLIRPLVPQDTRFTLACSLDLTHRYTTLECKVTTPSVHERVFVRYHVTDDPGCLGFSASMGVLNHTYHTQHMICYNPISLQASLSKKTQGSVKEELALKFGLIDVRTAEINLLDNVKIKLRLRPPFLLHAQACSGGSMRRRWQDIMHEARNEVNVLTRSARTLVASVASDVARITGLARVSRSTPACSLAQHMHTHTQRLLLELKQDQLLLDILHGVRACYDVTSVIIEAGVAYLSHTYGQTLTEVAVGAGVWVEAAAVNTVAGLHHLAQRLANLLTSTLTFIAYLPQALLNYVLTVPVVGQVSQWLMAQVRWLAASATFSFVRTSLMSAGHLVHKVLSLLYSGDEDRDSQSTSSAVWNLWVPLPWCSHSLFDVWRYTGGRSGGARHQVSLQSAVSRWWHLITHPLDLTLHFTPPFTAQGAIIGNTNFVSLDGRSYSLASPCAHVLVTDARDGLFTLITGWDNTQEGRDYLLLLGNTAIKVSPNLQVSVNGTVVRLPYLRRTVSVKRDVHHVVLRARDLQGRDVVTLTCWTPHRACVVSVSGWLHADTRGLLGNLNLEPSDDFMRPSGKVAVSEVVFGESWQLDPRCQAEGAKQDPPCQAEGAKLDPRCQAKGAKQDPPCQAEGAKQDPRCQAEGATINTPPSVRPSQLCSTFLLHYDAPLFPCHETVDIRPFHETCTRLLASLPSPGHKTQVDVDVDIGRGAVSQGQDTVGNTEGPLEGSTSQALLHVIDSKTNTSVGPNTRHKASNVQDMLSTVAVNPAGSVDGTMHHTGSIDATEEEVTAVCDVLAAYSTVCGEHDVTLAMPPLCSKNRGKPVREPLWPAPRLDLLMLVNEARCDSLMYQHLIRPLPPLLQRIARQKNISDIEIGVVGYGSGGGDVVYHTSGTSFLSPVSQFRATQPRNKHHAQGSLLQGLTAVTTFPFRPGSVRVAFVVSCDDQDLPQYTESVTKEMLRRRLVLFTLTPDLLLVNPSRPTAVRNTIGVDRWRVYNLRLDDHESPDSWGIKPPHSNIAQLALKSGGGVFTTTALREDDRAQYYMKLFRKVLSKAFVKVVSNTYKLHLSPSPLN